MYRDIQTLDGRNNCYEEANEDNGMKKLIEALPERRGTMTAR